MDHQYRAENAVRRVLAPHLHKSDLFELLAAEFARVLRRTEREAYRHGVRAAANAVGHVVGGSQHPAFQAAIALETKR